MGTGRLIFELGGLPERELDKLKAEADRLGKGSFAFAFYMDRQKEERERGVTISCTTKEFFTEKWHYTIIDAPGHRDFIKLGYSPIGFVRCGRSACRATAFKFKVGKETGGKKMEAPHSLKSNEMAQVSFRPQQPMVVDSFKNCEGLSRIAFLDGNTAVMLGKVVSVIKKSDMPPEETGKKKK